MEPQPPFSVVGPPVRHTDECITDAARYGFCEHTMLGRTRPEPAAHTPAAFRRKHPHFADVMGTLAFILIMVCFLITWHAIGWWALLVVNGVIAGGFVLLVTGPPDWLTKDLSHTLPPRGLYPKD